MLKEVVNLDTGGRLYFDAITPYEAMSKLVYYFNTINGREKLTINKTVSGQHLYVDYRNNTYCIRND